MTTKYEIIDRIYKEIDNAFEAIEDSRHETLQVKTIEQLASAFNNTAQFDDRTSK